MYSALQESHEPSQISRLVVAKFSYTTTSANHSGPLSWAHIVGHGDIVVVFEKLPALAPAAAHTFLKVFQNNDILEAIDLSHYAREVTYSHQSQSMPGGNAKSPFAVIVKLPCLAIKYPIKGQYVRRIQVKFSSDGDYYTALAILSDMRCPFSEPTGNVSRPASRVASSVWHLDRAPPGLIASDSVSASPSTSSAFANGIVAPSAHTFTEAPNLSGPALSLPSIAYPPPLLTPTTPNISQGNGRVAPEHSQPPSESGAIEQCSSNTASRPSTAATACHDPQALRQLLPPKRELPFSKTSSKGTRETEQPASTVSEADAAPKPTSVTNTSKKSVGNNHQRKATRKPTAAKSTPSTRGPKRCHTSLPSLTTNNNTGTSPTSLSNHPSVPSETNTKQQQQQPLSGTPYPSVIADPFSETVPSSNTTSKAWEQTALNDTTAHPSSHHPQSKSADSRDNSRRIINADLSSYLSAPSPERAALVENWICSQIEDDGFLQLCQDVEGVWKRVALGRML